MVYLTTIGRFTFKKLDEKLIVSHQRDDSWLQTYTWPRAWTVTDDDLRHKLYTEYYKEAFSDHPYPGEWVKSGDVQD